MFQITFIGRPVNSEGIFSEYTEIVDAFPEEEAILSFYHKYDHIKVISIKKLT